MRHYKCDKCYDTGRMRGDILCDAEGCKKNDRIRSREAESEFLRAIADSIEAGVWS